MCVCECVSSAYRVCSVYVRVSTKCGEGRYLFVTVKLPASMPAKNRANMINPLHDNQV
jgi:hypothetical protein